MNIEQLIHRYLRDVLHLSLATVRDNAPWVSEVHFAYDEGLNLYFRSLPSCRHSQEIIRNPRVAGNIVKQHALDEPVVGVYFEGSARQLTPQQAKDKAFICIQQRFHADDSILAKANRPEGHQFYVIEVATYYLFGAFDGRPTQKYTLAWHGTKA